MRAQVLERQLGEDALGGGALEMRAGGDAGERVARFRLVGAREDLAHRAETVRASVDARGEPHGHRRRDCATARHGGAARVVRGNGKPTAVMVLPQP